MLGLKLIYVRKRDLLISRHYNAGARTYVGDLGTWKILFVLCVFLIQWISRRNFSQCSAKFKKDHQINCCYFGIFQFKTDFGRIYNGSQQLENNQISLYFCTFLAWYMTRQLREGNLNSVVRLPISQKDFSKMLRCFMAEKKWLPSSRQHFQMHFLEWICMNSD